MRRRTKWGGLAAKLPVQIQGCVAALALVTAALLVPASASAQSGHMLPVAGGGEIPFEEVFPEHQRWVLDCPPEEAFPPGLPKYGCLQVTAYDGELKLGDVNATIDDPLKVTVGIALDGLTPVIVMGGGDGGGGDAAISEVKVPGGLLGMPELDQLLDPLGVLSVTATPQLGEIGAEDGGRDLTEPINLETITLPLSIKLNNTLFGDNCQIGTPEEPFTINLTTGTTSPPEGIEPMSGKIGAAGPSEQFGDGAFVGAAAPSFGGRTGSRSVDNTFAVPEATKCDPLPRELHEGLDQTTKQVDSLLGGLLGRPGKVNRLLGNKGGLFNLAIDDIVGLPSPAGQNHMKISVDTAQALWDSVQAARGQFPVQYVAQPLHFGEVAVGETSEAKPFTIRNVGSDPVDIWPSATLAARNTAHAHDVDQFEVVSDGCAGQTLAQGEQCQLDIRFTPSETGLAAVNYVDFWSGPGGLAFGHHGDISGIGIEP